MADSTAKEDLYCTNQVVQILVFIFYSCLVIIFIWLPPLMKESNAVTHRSRNREEALDHMTDSNREEALNHMGGEDGIPSGNDATVISELKESPESQFDQDNKEKSCFEFEKQQNPTNPVDLLCCDGCVCHIGASLHVMHTNPTNFCDECGAPYLRETSKFCSKCGIKREVIDSTIKIGEANARLKQIEVIQNAEADAEFQLSMITEEINKLRNDISELKRYKNEEACVGVASGTVVQELESSLAKKGDILFCSSSAHC